ncbi:MAG: hypothetical protein ACUZ77_03840 [Candidatus Brocadiales bacterium]
MVDIEEMKKKRFQFLKKLYEMTEGDRYKSFVKYQIGEGLDFDKELTDKITQYLNGEELINFPVIGGYVAISHEGIREVEEALSNPDEPTSHFPPINIIYVGTMTNSQIQLNSPEATQIVTIDGDKLEELKDLIQSLRESINQLNLQPQQKSDFQAEIQTIEAQTSSSKPKASSITECLGSIRRILEGATGSVLASDLLSKIVTFLEMIKHA